VRHNPLLNNKIVPNKRNSAILLATILLAGGIIAFSNPSFMKEAQAQQEYYYEEMNDYERPSYYKNDNYEPREYQSDNKQQYASYGKDNSYKSKKHSGDSISLNINKLKCINNNVNINGNNNGSINVGNSGSSATGSGNDQGYLGVGSYGDNYGEGYNNGYNKQKDQGFTCIINNNNTNTNIVLGGGGNVTDGNGNVPEPETCEECFRAFLTEEQIDFFLGSSTLEDYCDAVESGNLDETEVRADLAGDASMADINAIIECLKNLGILPS
jgi:hypothetical protein